MVSAVADISVSTIQSSNPLIIHTSYLDVLARKVNHDGAAAVNSCTELPLAKKVGTVSYCNVANRRAIKELSVTIM